MPDQRRANPAWDQSTPGVHPSITRQVTAEEIEAVKLEALALSSSGGRRYLSEETRFLADSQDAAAHHRLNLDLAIKEKMDPRIVAAHRLALAANLANAGEFDEALKTISDRRGRRLAGFKEMARRIAELREAIDRDDGDECECERPRHKVPHHRTGNEVEIEIPRRHEVGMVFSKKHGKVVRVWQCHLCGHCNAHDRGAPANQAAMHHERKRAEASIRGKRVTGATIDLADNLADHALLRSAGILPAVSEVKSR